jgi:hypothetical protein
MMLYKKSLFFISTFYLIIQASISFSAETVDACATYQSTNKHYKVNITIYSGDELNKATHSLNYLSFRKYAVIFWQQNQASVIALSLPDIIGSVVGTSGTDQYGREWNITTYPDAILCKFLP